MMHPAQLFWRLLAGFLLLSLGLPSGARSIDDDALPDDPPLGPYNFSSYLSKAVLDDGLTHQFYLDTQLGVAKWAGIASSNGRTMPAALSVPSKIGVNGTDYPVVSVEPTYPASAAPLSLRVPDTVYEMSWGLSSVFVNVDTLYLGKRVMRLDATTLSNGDTYNLSFVRHVEFTTSFPPEVVSVSDYRPICALAHVPEGCFDNYASLNTLMPVMEGYRVGKAVIHCDRPGYLASRLAATGMRLRQINDLTVTGHLDANDLQLVSNDLPNLTALDLSGCDITVEKLTLPKRLKALRRFAMPEGFTSIKGAGELKQLEQIRFPASLKRIEQSTFASCKYLQNIIFNGNGLRAIEDRAFIDCKGTPRLMLPEGLEYIGNAAFNNWKDTLDVYLPSTLTLFGGQAFTHVRQLVCEGVLPPVCTNSSSYLCDNPSAVRLVVPRAGRQMYAESALWRNCGHVSTHDGRPERIAAAGEQTLRFTDAPDYRPHLVLDKYAPTENATSYWGAAVVPEDAALAFKSVTMDCNVDSNPTSTRYSLYCTPFVAKGSVYADATTVNLSMRGDHWYYLSFPFSVRVSDILPQQSTARVTVMTHDGYERSQDMTRYTSSWRQLGPDEVMEAYKGYALFPTDPTTGYYSKDIVLQVPAHDGLTAQNIYRTGAVSVPLELHPSEFAHNAHWTFVGNPYPCFYDISYLGTQQPIYISDGVSFKAYRPGVDDFILPPYQGFFIQRDADPSAVAGSEGAMLTFDPAGRQTSYKSLAHKAPSRVPDGMESPFLVRDYQLTLTSAADPTLTDRTLIVADPNASATYEPQRDAVKFAAQSSSSLGACPELVEGSSLSSSSSPLELATLSDGISYAINTRPATADAPLWLSVTAPVEGDYILALAEGNLVVDDLLEGTTVTITPATPYTFHTAAGTVADRFRVSITPGRFTEGVDAFSIIVYEPGKLREELETYIGAVPYADIKCLTITGALDQGDYDFIRSYLTSLVELDLRGTSTTEGTFYNDALSRMRQLEYVLLPADITAIGNSALSDCRALRHADIPDGVTSIGSGCYANCTSLETVVLPNSVTSIGDGCFSQCSSMREVTLSTGLTTIPNAAFSYCSLLQRINIPEGVVSVEREAFYECSALTDIELPSTLAYVGYRAFDRNTQFVALRSHAVIPPFAPYDDLLSARQTGIESSAPDKVTLIVPAVALKAYLADPTYARFGVVRTFEDTNPDYVPRTNVNLAGRHFVNYSTSFPSFGGAGGGPSLDFCAVHPDAYDRSNNLAAYVCDDANANHNSADASLTVVRGSEYHARNIKMSVLGFPDNQYVHWSTIVPHGTFTAESQQYQLTCRGAHWNFVSLPCAVRVGDFTPLDDHTQWTIYAYEGERRAAADFEGAWRRLTADDILQPGRGYILHGWAPGAETYSFLVNAPRSITFEGGEPATVALGHYPATNPDNADWNLVSNPYLSFYDIRHLETTTPITVWDDYSSHYHVYSPVDDAYVLRPMEAFFVQGVGDGQLSFDVEGPQACDCVRAIPATSRQRAAALMQRRLCNVVLSTSTSAASGDVETARDRTRIVFNNSAHIGYEAQWDAAKFMSMDTTVPELYTLHDGIRYAINERPDGDFAVELGLRVTTDAPLTLSLAPGTQGSAMLLDRLTGQTITLSAEEGKEATYTFSAEPGTVEGRFLLTYVPDGDVEGIEEIALDEPWTCPHGNVFDLSGRPLPSYLSPSTSSLRNGVTIDATGHKHIHR